MRVIIIEDKDARALLDSLALEGLSDRHRVNPSSFGSSSSGCRSQNDEFCEWADRAKP